MFRILYNKIMKIELSRTRQAQMRFCMYFGEFGAVRKLSKQCIIFYFVCRHFSKPWTCVNRHCRLSRLNGQNTHRMTSPLRFAGPHCHWSTVFVGRRGLSRCDKRNPSKQCQLQLQFCCSSHPVLRENIEAVCVFRASLKTRSKGYCEAVAR